MSNSIVDINQLSSEQIKELQRQLEDKQKLERERVNSERAKYKELVDITTRALFPVLKNASTKLSEAKSYVFRELATLIRMKEELYNRDSEQNTHSFSNEDGTITITVGYNIVDSWDDTVGTGITKVHDYIQTLIKDDNSKVLVDTVMDLLSQDAKQNLKASRVLKLRKMADKSGNKDFIDAIQIIQDAYKPVRTKEFVRVEFKGEHGEKQLLPLSITDAPFSELEDNNETNTKQQTTA
jgi:hypothetical protein